MDHRAIIREISRSAILDEAFKHLWHKYVYGSNGPKDFDCSGFVIYVLAQVGIWSFGDDTAQGIYNRYSRYKLSRPEKGCLIFWGDGPEDVSHVAFCLNDRAVIGAHGGAIRSVSVQPIDYRRTEKGKDDLVGYCDPVIANSLNS